MKGNPSLKSFWFSKKGEGGGGHNFKGAKGVPWMGLLLPWLGKVSQALWQVSKWDQTDFSFSEKRVGSFGFNWPKFWCHFVTNIVTVLKREKHFQFFYAQCAIFSPLHFIEKPERGNHVVFIFSISDFSVGAFDKNQICEWMLLSSSHQFKVKH